MSYTRGNRNWVVYPSGVSASFPVEEPTPDRFPWEVLVAKVIDGVSCGKLR